MDPRRRRRRRLLIYLVIVSCAIFYLLRRPSKQKRIVSEKLRKFIKEQEENEAQKSLDDLIEERQESIKRIFDELLNKEQNYRNNQDGELQQKLEIVQELEVLDKGEDIFLREQVIQNNKENFQNQGIEIPQGDQLKPSDLEDIKNVNAMEENRENISELVDSPEEIMDHIQDSENQEQEQFENPKVIQINNEMIEEASQRDAESDEFNLEEDALQNPANILEEDIDLPQGNSLDGREEDMDSEEHLMEHNIDTAIHKIQDNSLENIEEINREVQETQLRQQEATKVPQESLMQQRSNSLQNACFRWKDTMLDKNMVSLDGQREQTREIKPMLLIYRPAQIRWCMIGKVASPMFLSKFATILDIKRDTNNHEELANRLIPDQEDQDSGITNSFIIVKHPFDRVLTAYRDIFWHQRTKLDEQLYQTLGAKIITTYRREPVEDIRFSNKPTFGEFVMYIIDTPVNQHSYSWMPFYVGCDPCHLRYNIILKTETLDDEIDHLVEATGFKSLRYYDTREKDPQEQAIRAEIDKTYFADLTWNLLERLYKVYQIDFEMFQYSVQPYSEYVKPN